MSEQHAFGPNLRRVRMQRGIALDQISDKTKVKAELFAGLERNDFSRWPTGIFARSFVRAYAKAIGEDPEATVNEFCRWFPQGDRRVGETIRVQAEIVGHENLVWKDEVPAAVAEGDRRASAETAATPAPGQARSTSGALSAFAQMFMRLRRLPR
jgi:Helix-turn-helix domain